MAHRIPPRPETYVPPVPVPQRPGVVAAYLAAAAGVCALIAGWIAGR